MTGIAEAKNMYVVGARILSNTKTMTLDFIRHPQEEENITLKYL